MAGKMLLVGFSVRFETEGKVIELLSDYFSMDYGVIVLGSSLVEDLYVDSIELLEIVMMLNDAFGIVLPEREVANLRVVDDICCLVWAEQSLIDN
ncbi:phosphopantetheine-binding protein [Pseudomonas zanjanensis]|nr:phosphopantetheine-binding protein [Pseudomonas zanjanensis]